MQRRTFVACTAAALLAPRVASAQSLTTIRIGATPQGDIVGALWAEQQGIFQKNGMDVSVLPMNSGAAITAAVVGGSLEIGKISMLNLIQAHARGIPLVIECPAALYESDIKDATGMIVAKDSPIRTGRDLNGKTFAVPALGDLFTLVSSTWIDKTGGDSSTVKFLELPGMAAAEAIAGGRVDAATLAQPTLKDAVAGGKCKILTDPFAAVAPRFFSTAFACTADFATKNAALMARFRRVISDANTYADKHAAEMLPIMAKFSGVDQTVLANLPFTPIGTTATLKDARTMIQPLIDMAVRYKAIPHTYDAKDLIDPAALA